MAAASQLENALNDIFVKKAPKLPENAVKWIVRYLPWINLFLGVVTLWSAYVLWHWTRLASDLINYSNSLNKIYGVSNTVPVVSRLTFGIWLGLIVLTIEAVLYIAAFPGTRDRKKAGWNLLYYAALMNIVYGIVVTFTSYGGGGNLLGSLIGSAIGLYFLFQIRSAYN